MGPVSPDRTRPRISVVTPSYNQAEFLEATMESIHGPGYPNLEHIVIDGGSTDGSVEIIERYADRLAYWHFAPREWLKNWAKCCPKAE